MARHKSPRSEASRMIRAWRWSVCLSAAMVTAAACASDGDTGSGTTSSCDGAVDKLDRCNIDETYLCNDGWP